MYQFSTSAARGGFAGLALVACLAVSTPSAAAQIFIRDTTPHGGLNSQIGYIAPTADVPALPLGPDDEIPSSYTLIYVSPLLVQANFGIGPAGGAPVDFLGFCLDPFIPAPSAPGVQYGDTPVSDALRNQIGLLVNFGEDLYAAGSDPDLTAKLAGVQGAIWEILNPGFTVMGATNGTPDQTNPVSLFIQQYALGVGVSASSTTFRMIGDADHSFQPIAFGAGGVPEPEAWTLMVGGFAAVGLGIRTRRRKAIAALA